MGFVEGDVLHDAETARRVLDEGGRRATGLSFVDVLADLHAVDPDAIGLSDFARKDGYIARQLKRWYGQWQQSKTRNLPAVDRVHDILAARIPPQETASVVHGDYRLGNCLCLAGRIQAVLDWEICTLGDPLADVGYVLATWPQPSDPVVTDPTPPSMAPGFPPRQEILDRYAIRSGRDVSLIDFYVTFSYWKSACILEGVYARYLGGARGDTTLDVDPFRERVDGLAAQADLSVARLS
jgi:aminoglycoside phosphotransferase (APT) family kinase protein